ncbi:MAG TPA: SPOR domain-containing protein [Steroidobacteraceae bacterium]|jgi:cell division protein FtsN|nr:SPOR domain-containing protein [Steroidobacteraceae bacterium]
MRFEISRYREFWIGLALGLSVSVLVLVWQNYREKIAASVTAETPKPEPRSDKAAAVGDAEDSPKNYDFYDMLPKFEVVVPEKDREVARERDTARAAIERPGVYVLQAGSYRNQEEADRIQALLKKQGIDANVQRVAVDDDVWHRVRIGPITDLAELNRLRARLRAAEFDDALVIRVGD